MAKIVFNPLTGNFDMIGSGANTALSNLASVAINTSLISDTDSTDDLGSSAKKWSKLYVDDIVLGDTPTISTESNANLSLVPNGTGYTIIGTGTTSHSLNSPNDGLVSGRLEVDGIVYLDNARIYWTNGLGWLRPTTDLLIQTQDTGATVLHISSGGDSNVSGFYITTDSANPTVNANSDFGMLASTQFVQFIADTAGNAVIFTNILNRLKDHDHALQTNPTLYVHSDTDPDTNNTQWLSLTHDQTNGVIATGLGYLSVLNGLGVTGNLGFFGTAPTTQQTELTDELTTITHTAPGTPDYAVQDLVQNTGFGFVTKDEGNSVLAVIANLQTRVNELETKLTAYGLLIDAD